MYDIVKEILGHEWLPSGGTEQILIYYICGILIVLLVVTFIDLIYRLFRHFWR